MNVKEEKNSSGESVESPRPALVWSWWFDPLEPERGVEITYGGKACAVAPTLNNALLLVDRLNGYDKLLAEQERLAVAEGADGAIRALENLQREGLFE